MQSRREGSLFPCVPKHGQGLKDSDAVRAACGPVFTPLVLTAFWDLAWCVVAVYRTEVLSVFELAKKCALIERIQVFLII